MDSVSQNGQYENLGYFSTNRTEEERKKLAETYGDIPEVTNYDINSVISWGRPWWRICEVVYGRNSRCDSLTDDDDIQTWKALLYTLAEKIKHYSLPSRLRGVITRDQWQEDMFADASTELWILIKNAKGKMLSIQDTAWIAITRAARQKGTNPVPANFDMERFRHRLDKDEDEEDPVASLIDQAEEDSLLDRRLAVRLEFRVPEELVENAKEIYSSTIRQNPATIAAYPWMNQLVAVHRKLIRRACRIKENDWRAKRGFRPILPSHD